MGSSRKSSAKKLPYKVFGKKVVDADFKFPGGMEGFSTVPVRNEWPRDDERYRIGQEESQKVRERLAREEATRPVWHYELVYGPKK